MAKKAIIAAVSGLVASAATASIPHSRGGDLPPSQRAGTLTYRTGGARDEEVQALKKVARDYPLQLVFVERTGRKENYVSDMPLRIIDEQGKVVFDGQAAGPYFLARLPKGRYTVSTRWDAFASSRPVTVGSEPKKVVFAWGKAGSWVAA